MYFLIFNFDFIRQNRDDKSTIYYTVDIRNWKAVKSLMRAFVKQKYK